MVDSILGLSSYFSTGVYDIALKVGNNHKPENGFYWYVVAEMITRSIVSNGRRELGVVRDNNMETLAIGHVLAGISAGLDRKSVDFNIDNLYGATISGTLARSVLHAAGNDHVIAERGAWDTNCPPHYLLNTRLTEHVATPAAIIGDVDGFIIGEKLLELFKTQPDIKLSTALTQYYGSGLNNDVAFSSNSRFAAFQSLHETESKLLKEIIFACKYYKNEFSIFTKMFGEDVDCESLAEHVVDTLNRKILEVTKDSVNYSCFGDIMNMKPTGASMDTATQDGLTVTGVAASNQLLDTDVEELAKRRHCYVEAGKKNCIHPALIAALASRLSRGGRLLQSTDGYGFMRAAYGILQCHIENSAVEDCKIYEWDTCEHINLMVRKDLLDKIRRVKRKHPSWSTVQQLQGGVAAYNFGVSNVQTWENLDSGSTGNDFSNDVIARAQRLVTLHGWTYGGLLNEPVENHPVTDCEALLEEGNCDFYECMEGRLQCGSDGYLLAYGLRYCNRFNDHYKMFNEQGRKWIDAVRECLMKALLNITKYSSLSCDEVRDAAFVSHPDCYEKSGINFCDIVLNNKAALFRVFEFKDFIGEQAGLAWQQIMDMVGRCTVHWSKEIWSGIKEIWTDVDEMWSDLGQDVENIFEQFSTKARDLFQSSAEEDSQSCERFADTGDCRFYKCFEKRFPCSALFEIKLVGEFAYAHCKFNKGNQNLFDKTGQSWLQNSERCLMQSLLPLYRSDAVNCAILNHHMFKARQECYIDAGFCTLVHSRENEWALHESFNYFGFPMVIPPNDLQLTYYYYHTLFDLERAVLEINYQCYYMGLTPYNGFYRMIQSEKTGVLMKVKYRDP